MHYCCFFKLYISFPRTRDTFYGVGGAAAAGAAGYLAYNGVCSETITMGVLVATYWGLGMRDITQTHHGWIAETF